MVSSFPTVDLLPKRETNALRFIEEHPDYNGKDVIIGILDTGVDPGAHGIATMEDGITPKLIDMVDCTGSGDVDVSTIQQTVDPGEEFDFFKVKVLSGKTLKLKKDWWKAPQDSENLCNEKPPTVQLGVKLAYELYPTSVVNRVKAYRQTQFEKEVQSYIADARSGLSKLSGKKSQEDIKLREELNARIDILTDKEWTKENDPGPVLDCVVFFDGQDQRALVVVANENEEEIDCTNEKPLTAFHKECRYSTISSTDQYNYGVNFYEDNKVLSIVGDCTPHGTHVAAIAAAAEGERSGIAPGAKLVSIKIGDSRLGSMETGSSLVRGIMAAVRLGCDIINLSYGEASQISNAGRFIQMAEELVWRHNIIFVSATGNNGPALTTVNAPGGISSCIIGVAAYVSPEMMQANYSLESNTDDKATRIGSTYTWSSVGPAQDGYNGVCVSAPGGAITSVSNWTLQKSMLMNGTSMAAPNACGCIALLLSACKAKHIPISQARIRRAIENSAKCMPNLSPIQQGYGLVQVDEAFDHLVATKDIMSEDIHFQVTLEGRSGNPRGVYLRQADESSRKQAFSVRIDPKFQRQDGADQDVQRSKIEFETKFIIKPSEAWISAPDIFMLMSNGRSFKILVNPCGLKHGVHCGRVDGFDADHPERGIVWSLPVTIVKPFPMQQHIDLPKLSFEPAETKRFFVVPPHGTSWMDITVRDCRDDLKETAARLFVLHTVQLLPHSAYRDNSKQKYLSLSPSQTSITSISVQAGVTCEIDIGRYWSTAGVSSASIEIEFRGVRPNPPEILMKSGDAFAHANIINEGRDEIINPSAKLSKWRTPIRPKMEGIINPLGERDIHPWNAKKTYELVLTYEFSQDEKGSFTPIATALQEVLYESIYEAQLIMAYDCDKKYLGCCDAYPSSIAAPKGQITLKMQVRHDDPSMLEKVKDMTLWIERNIDKEISLSAFSTREDVFVGRKLKKRTLRKGSQASVFFAEPSTAKLPSACQSGDLLIGSCTYCSGDSSLPGEGKHPVGFPFHYVIGPKMDKASTESDTVEEKDLRIAEERMNEAIRDLKVGQLDKLTKDEQKAGKFESMYQTILEDYPTYVPLHMSNLKYLDANERRDGKLMEIVSAADKVLELISQDELALHFGRKHDKDIPQKAKKNKEMEKRKGQLIEALVRKALACCDLGDSSASEQFEKSLENLKSWVDIDANGKYILLSLERDRRLGRYGMALKRINKLLSKNAKDTGGVKPLLKSDLLKRRAGLLGDLSYIALQKRDIATKFVASPPNYRLF